MKAIHLPFAFGICMMPITQSLQSDYSSPLASESSYELEDAKENSPDITFQSEEGSSRMRSIVFKSQEYCRAELKDFEFDIQYKVVGATVYFTGENFKTMAKGTITSNSLQPIRSLMDKCVPGTTVIFDDVKVKGPDNEIRIIPGIILHLY